jgi:hypothetical protein
MTVNGRKWVVSGWSASGLVAATTAGRLSAQAPGRMSDRF